MNSSTAGLDLILIEPVATEGLEEACARAHAARIPVVAIGSAVSGADAVVATDNTKAGSLAGTALAKALDGQGRVAVVGGIPITANSDRIAGFLAAIAAAPQMTVIATSYGELDTPSGERAAEEILAAHPTVDGFFASNDQIAIGISRRPAKPRARPCRSSGSMAPRNAVEEIRAGGPIIATATQDPAALVRAAMEIGSALHGGARRRSAIALPGPPVDRCAQRRWSTSHGARRAAQPGRAPRVPACSTPSHQAPPAPRQR